MEQNWNEETDAFDEEKALAFYTAIIDVASISGASAGWRVLCKENPDLVRSTTMVSRVVTVFGEYKSGKTWLLGQLMDTQSPSCKTLNTPGLGIIIPKKVFDEALLRNKEAPGAQSLNTPPPKQPGGRGRRPNPIPLQQVMAAGIDVDCIVIDSQGTGKIANETNRQDILATELFLRDVQLTIADRFIYVTTKFNRHEADTVMNLIRDLNSDFSGTTTKSVSSTQRLILVHNLYHVTHQHVLHSVIREVANHYIHSAPPGSSLAAAWMALNPSREASHSIYTTDIPAPHQGAVGIHIDHIFFVNDPVNKQDWGFAYNQASLVALKQRLNTTSPREFNLIAEFMKRSETCLHNYLKVAAEAKEKNQPFPVTWDSDVDGNNWLQVGPVESDIEAEPYELVVRSWDQVWESSGDFKLPCNVLRNLSELKYYVLVSVPGLKAGDEREHVQISVSSHHRMDIRVNIPQFVPNENCTRTNRTEIKHGLGLVSHDFPPDIGFAFEKDYISCCKIDAGVLVITLAMDVPPGFKVK